MPLADWEILSMEQFRWRREIGDLVLDMVSWRCLLENQLEIWARVWGQGLGWVVCLGAMSIWTDELMEGVGGGRERKRP